MQERYIDLKDIRAYCKAFELSNLIWDLVIKWEYFSKDTLGKQLVKAVDSISANIAEGFGRYYKKDKIVFYRYSAGSLKETTDWIEKAIYRKLINTEEFDTIQEIIKQLQKK